MKINKAGVLQTAPALFVIAMKLTINSTWENVIKNKL